MRTLLDRLKQSKIAQWGLGYLAASGGLYQALDAFSEPWGVTYSVLRGAQVLLVVGFLIVLVLAWHHGEKGRQRVGATEAALIAGLLAVGGGALVLLDYDAVDAQRDRSFDDVGALTLAVLPFESLSPDPGDDYLGDGLTAALQGELLQIGLDVAAKTSTAGYRGVQMDVRKIGSELGVRFLLSGSVFTDGRRLRINVQLSDATTGFDMWSAEYTGDVDEIFDVQEHAALGIAQALGIELTAQQTLAGRRRYTDNVEAYRAYLKGRRLLESFHITLDVPEERLREAKEEFERAIALDSEYALAIAGLSQVEGYYVFHGFDTSEERRQRALRIAEQALALDSILPEAHAALGDANYVARDLVRAIGNYETAVALDPDNGVAWCHLASACNRTDDAVTAELAARKAIGVYPAYALAYGELATALAAQDKLDEAIDAYEDQVRYDLATLTPFYGIASIHLDRGDHEAALATYERARDRRETPLLLSRIAFAYAGSGDLDRALAELEAALEAGYRSFLVLETEELLAPLREDGRLGTLLDRYR